MISMEADYFFRDLDDAMINEYAKNGYDVEIGLWIRAGEEYQVKVSAGKTATGKISYPIRDFYKLMNTEKIEVLYFDNESEKELFKERWIKRYNTEIIPDTINLYIGLMGQKGRFYESMEDFLYNSATSDVKWLIDEFAKTRN